MASSSPGADNPRAHHLSAGRSSAWPPGSARSRLASAPPEAGALHELTDEDRSSIRILVVDDEQSLREGCSSILETEGFDVTVCGRGEEAAEILKTPSFDIALVDLYMSQVSGMELLSISREAMPERIVVVMTGNPSVESSIHALRAGAWNYLSKPFSASNLKITVGQAAHTVMVARESSRDRGEEEDRFRHSDAFPLLGKSEAFENALEIARRVAPTDASVFLTGESGTGKELMARYIHMESRRTSRDFVAVNCAALSESLLESEMFGHVEGAFTGAVRDKTGLLEQANGGTLFLDELTDMPMAVQGKLLRVIQDGVVRKVGSAQDNAVVNVRFISATNRDLAESLDEDRLRRDLSYRLRVVTIELPPLRDRMEDIPILVRHFCELFWSRHRGNRVARPDVSDAAMDVLMRHDWPGNVRELRNVIEHTLILADPETEIQPADLKIDPIPSRRKTNASAVFESGNLLDGGYHDARERVLTMFEKYYLRRIVQKANGNISDAARMADVDRTTLYRLMEKHDLGRDEILNTSSDASGGARSST